MATCTANEGHLTGPLHAVTSSHQNDTHSLVHFWPSFSVFIQLGSRSPKQNL